ncbi:Rab3 GTPase-activating protein non-catalytic subunit [Aphanomyces cochlioides]|nr:Rab3 GTPase-activating protein non-catalytic subunit [Aphanomyces cochlioides]
MTSMQHAMGTTAVLGGILHHMAFKAMHHFNIQLAKVARRVFGLYLKQSTVDWCLRWVWRLVLGFTTLTNFALVAAPASRYLSSHLSEWTIWVAGVGYSLVGIAAFIKMQTSIMLLGFMPPMLFGGISALTTLDKGWLCEILVLVFIFIGGAIQAIEASPSHKHFNHNALAHVFLSASATTMMMRSSR